MEDKKQLHLMGLSTWGGGSKVKRIFKVRMAKNLPCLIKMTNPKIQQAE